MLAMKSRGQALKKNIGTCVMLSCRRLPATQSGYAKLPSATSDAEWVVIVRLAEFWVVLIPHASC
jgi:hypothetical protein